MEQERSFKEYLNEVKELLTESFAEKFFFSGASDVQAARELYSLGVEPIYLLYVLQEEGLGGRFCLSQVKELVKEKYKRDTENDARKAAQSYYCEVLPYRRLEKLAAIVKSVLVKLEVEDFGIVERLKELQEEEELLEIERELMRLEELLFKLLERTSPYAKECEEFASRHLEKYAFYWNEKLLELTKKALLRRCLRLKHGIPEFTALQAP
jgi:hypothetical protein